MVYKAQNQRQEPECLSCKNFRLQDVQSGVCRVDRGKIEVALYPLKRIDDLCEQWLDCGQQYHIRTGWIDSQKKKSGK